MKRKKLLSIVMAAIVLLCSLSPIAVQAQESLDAFPEEGRFKENRAERLEEIRLEVTPQEGNVNTAGKTGEEYTYRKLKNGTLEITGYEGNDTELVELVVPAKIDGKRVTSIGEEAFYNCRSLTGIELPAGVTSIGFDAFSGCSSLTSIELPAGVTSIDCGAFSGCSSLTSIELPAGVTSIGGCAFYKCSSLTRIELPVGVTSIGFDTFSRCSSLTRIELPAGVTSIGEEAFYNCRSLTGIELPAGVTSIEDGAFSGCSSLTRIELPAGVKSIRDDAFSGCSSLMEIMVDENNSKYVSQEGVLYNKNKTKLICCPGGKTGDIVIPTSVIGIGFDAFSGCSSLTSIELPAGVKSIGSYAFSSCSSLMEIMVDENNSKYVSQEGVLYNKDKTELICCPGGKTGDIVIPTSVTKIGFDAFSGCSSLTSIELPAGVTYIGGGAFSGRSLTEIMVDENNAKYASQDGVLYNKDKTELICCPGGKTGDIVIPTSVTSIGDGAFSGCSSLTSIELPEGVTYIGEYVFSGCSSLISIKLPASLTSIELCAFQNCENLILFVYKGSYAAAYAEDYGCNYRYMNDCSHTFDTTIVKATAKKNGSITKTCTKCGEQTQKIIYAAKTIKMSKTSGTYNGKNQKPSVTVKDRKGKTLANKKHYTVTYPKTMKNVGCYTVTIKLKGNYKGTVKKTFQIVPKGTQISKVTPKKKGFALKWKKQAVQTTGYEIVYSTDKKFTEKTTGTIVIDKNKTVSKTVSKLKAGKKYYVRIRTYKTIKLNGKSKKLYSSWSKIKTVTT